MKNIFIIRWCSPWDTKGKEFFRKFKTKNAVDKFIKDKALQYPFTALVFYVFQNRQPIGIADYRASWNCE